MIVGSGMLAQAFEAYRDAREITVFASGVSDSLERREAAFIRERDLLLATRAAHPDALLLYFGTCSIYDPDSRDTPYVAHKVAMESALANAGGPWLVLRLPLAIGPGHRGRALAHYLYDRIRLGEPFDLWTRAIRYPIDVSDVVRVAGRFIAERASWNRRINVALRGYPVVEFVRVFEGLLGRAANVRTLDKGSRYAIDCPELDGLSNEFRLDRDDGYLARVLRKHFSMPGNHRA